MTDYRTPQSLPESSSSISTALTSPQHLHALKHPCILCQQRKVKCDRNIPCANCCKARVECISSASLPPRKRKKRFSEAELLARIRRYEEHLKGYGADLKAINEGLVAAKTVSGDMDPAEAEMKETPKMLSLRRSPRQVESNLWDGVNEQFRETEELLQGSSEDEMFETPIIKSYDELYVGSEDFLRPLEKVKPLGDLHPPSVNIFQLWQIFLESVNPLTKIFHAPTVQSQILEASLDLSSVSRNMEALMFSMYSAAVYSLGIQQCRDKFGQERDVLLHRYHSGAREALHRAEFLKSSDIMILQALLLYLLSCVHFSMDPRSLCCLNGIAIRMGQRIRLHSDDSNIGLNPFQVEMRRRLWWQLVLLDARIAELSGAGSSVLTYTWTTKLPSNVNDSDLFADMKETPLERPGITEMVFVLQRCEVFSLQQTSNLRTRRRGMESEQVDDMEKLLQERYIRYCDASVPLHAISTMTAKISISKERMGHRKSHFMDLRNDSSDEKDRLFRHAVTIIETHNQMIKSSRLQHFQWYMWTQFPLPAHLYVLLSLRYRTKDELAEQAWIQIAEIYKFHDALMSEKKSPTSLHLAIAKLTVKAWEARENDLERIGAQFTVPHFISTMRQKISEKKQTSSNRTPTDFGSTGVVGLQQELGENSNAFYNQGNYAGMEDAVLFSAETLHVFDQIFSEDQIMMGWDAFGDAVGLENGSNHY